MNKNIKLLAMAIAIIASSCETTELDITDNPNALTPEQASVEFFLNSIQEDFVRNFEGDADGSVGDNWDTGGNTNGDGFNEFGMTLTRNLHLSGRNYSSAFQDLDTGDEWANCYLGILADVRAMTPLAEAAGQTRHIGITQFIEAYLMITMVDFLGDVPYSETIQGSENLNPKLDSGAEIYAQMVTLIDQAIGNFNSTPSADPQNDFFYDNDFSKWVKAANTLKLKIYTQSRLVDPSAEANFNAIIASGNYIQDTEDDFDYIWPAASAANPDSRHPRFGINYTAGGAVDYMANWLMNLMNTTDDPRIRYYFYRQTDAVPGAEIPGDEALKRCSVQTAPTHYVDGGFIFCSVEDGYWGRDHGNSVGIPPDGLLRTTWGVYPAGGRFDDDAFEPVTTTSGAGGNGITNLLTAFGVDFMRAEFAMANGDMVNARTFMLAGYDKAIAKVQDFSSTRIAGSDMSFEPTAGEITAYRNTISTNFDMADTEGQWNILAEQYFLSHFGNGVEVYNFYRRTNYPTTLQANIEVNPDTFVQSLYYPDDAVNNNSNISQKPDQAQPVFWDNNGVPPAN